jgi:MFS family permease
MNSKERRYSLTHYLLGALPARVADEMSGQTILLISIAATGMITLGSTLLAALTISAALGGPLLGTLLDRSCNPGKVLAGALSLYALGLGLIALSLGYVPTWASIMTATAIGVFMPAISGGWSSRLKSFIADEQMVRASSIDATTFNIAGLVGPAVAGLTAAVFGAYWAIAIIITLLVAALPMAWQLPKHSFHGNGEAAPNLSFWRDVTSGLKVIISNKLLFRITLTSVISYIGIGMLWVIYPLVGKELFGKAGYGGVLASILSAGAIVATIAYAKWPERHSPDVITFVTTIMLAVAMLVLAFAGNIAVTLLAVLIAGLADGPQLAAIFAVRHREAPEHLRSQVFTTGASLKITAAAVGAELAGLLGGSSLRLTILVACTMQLAAAGTFVIVTAFRGERS